MPEDKNKRLNSKEESNLFRQSMNDVKPLSTEQHVIHTGKQKPRPIKKNFIQKQNEPLTDFQSLVTVQSDDMLFYAQQGLQDKTIRRLKKGTIAIDERVDLHGLNKQDAQQLLHEFLSFHLEERNRCILVIHGKGMGSSSAMPALKNLVFNMLTNDPAVLAFSSAQPKHGGTGAVYVLLKKHYSSDV